MFIQIVYIFCPYEIYLMSDRMD